MNLKSVIFLFIPFFVFSQKAPKPISEIESLYLNYSSKEAIRELNLNISYYKVKPKEQLNLIRNYNLLGEVYLSENEFEQSLRVWKTSFELTKRSFGVDCIYMAEIYTMFSKYYSFLIKSDSAYIYSKRAIELCRKNRNEINNVSMHKIYRQFTFSSKIYFDHDDKYKSRVLARKLYDSAQIYNRKFNLNNQVFIAEILTDIGNTYTDETLFYYIDGKQTNSDDALLKANQHYDSAITIRKRFFNEKNYLVAQNYFLKALSYNYNNQRKSNPKVMEFLQKALCTITPGYNDLSIQSFPNYKAKFINSLFTLQILRYKIDEFYRKYADTNDTIFLHCAYGHSKEAVKLWKKTFRELQNNEIHIALETYGNSPFIGSISAVSKFYEISHNKNAEKDLMEWIDLIKYESILKSQFSGGNIKIDSTSFSITKVQEKLSNNECIIEYYVANENVYAFIISKNNFQFFPAKKYLNLNKIDSLNHYLLKHKASKYCSFAKEIYDSILAPFLEHLPIEINHLVIIPHDKLCTVPFDALVLNNSRTYKSADYLINHYEISQALSARLWLNNNQGQITRDITYSAPKYKKHTYLPFNQELIEKLKKSYNLLDFILKDTGTKTSILHVSGHAFNDDNNSRISSLKITDSTELNLYDISRAKLNYAIAVINACETAKGNQETGEGTINFSRHFYLAGVKSTITTLWKVDDEATASILTGFYNNLLIGHSTIKSLHLAKLNYLSNPKTVDDCDPYYWAGLIYTGNDLEMKKTNDYVLYLIFAISFGVLFLLIRKFFFKAN